MENINMGGQISSADFGQFSFGGYNLLNPQYCFSPQIVNIPTFLYNTNMPETNSSQSSVMGFFAFTCFAENLYITAQQFLVILQILCVHSDHPRSSRISELSGLGCEPFFSSRGSVAGLSESPETTFLLAFPRVELSSVVETLFPSSCSCFP
ncbi:hypothetical protein Thermo_01679 [Thermoplasmatales archaeon]|nr:hypothetical protein Thermo_01679 [Thermoplasmatales archaeon]